MAGYKRFSGLSCGNNQHSKIERAKFALRKDHVKLISSIQVFIPSETTSSGSETSKVVQCGALIAIKVSFLTKVVFSGLTQPNNFYIVR